MQVIATEREVSGMTAKTVFYSWQAQRPNKCNRTLIEDALERALRELAARADAPIEFRLDQDARGAPGACEISAAILEKIDRCSIFVADITPVGSLINERPTPNPNVLFELGYAWKALGENCVILVLNEAFGKPEDLPFDISKRNIIRYTFDGTPAGPADARKHLQAQLRDALSSMAQDDHMRLLRESGLRPTDIALFKAVYAWMLKENNEICDYETVLQMGEDLNLNEEGVEDATEMISDLGFWSADPNAGPRPFCVVRATTHGMEPYLSEFLPNYSALSHEIKRHILNGMTRSDQLAEKTGQSQIVVEHMMQILQDNDYICITKPSTSGVGVWEVKPKLKREFGQS